jgi:ubiquinone/menaquinone biosynthesis C-methylase UbiE
MLQSYTALIQLANACGGSQILLAANALGLFTVIGTKSRAADEIARECRADHEGMRLLLDALASLGILNRVPSGYRNTALGRRYLDRRSPEAITNLLWLFGHHWHDWTKLPRALRKGRPGWAPETSVPEFRRRFSLAMHERSHVLAAPTVQTMRLNSSARRFLDLGGGPGSYAIELARRYPQLEGVIIDQTTTIATRLIREHGLAGRLKVRAGDIFKDDLGSGYDAVLCSNVIHIFNERQNRKLLRRAARALRTGGKLYIVEFFLDTNRTAPSRSAVFSVMMYLYTATGQCYSWSEVESWLKELGFGRFKRHRITPDIGTLEAIKLT